MSFKERNLYQAFIIQICGFTNPDDFFKVGLVFAQLEKDLNRCPTPYEIVQKVL